MTTNDGNARAYHDEMVDEINRLSEQLRLATIDAANLEAIANDLRRERDQALDSGYRWVRRALDAERLAFAR